MKLLRFYIVLKVLHPISSAITLQVPISFVDSVDSEGIFVPLLQPGFDLDGFLQHTNVCIIFVKYC